MTFPNISPVALEIGGFAIRWYAVAYILGFILALAWVRFLLRRTFDANLSQKDLDDLASYGILGVLIGGRLGYALFYNPSFYIAHPVEVLKIWNGGMSFHGGFIGSVAALWIWTRNRGKGFAMVADLFACAAPIGLFLGRMANFVNAELYGRRTSGPFGMVFPGTDGMPRHPSQLYEAGLEGVVLFAVLDFARRFPRMRPGRGALGSCFVLLYGVARFAVEFLREPDAHMGFLALGLTMGQLLSIPAIVLGGACAAWCVLRKQKPALCVSSMLLNNFPSVSHGFFTRNGGVSGGPFATANCRFETSDSHKNVAENRRRALSLLGLDADASLFTLAQGHTAKVVVVSDDPAHPGAYLHTTADALVMTKPGMAAGVLTADCVPVLVADVRLGIVAAMHCGWKGLSAGVVESTFAALGGLGSRVEDLRVALGPCLKLRSYKVDAAFRDGIVASGGEYARLFRRRGGKYRFDITGYAVAKLNAQGVPTKNIDVVELDTFSRPAEFFSYRRSLLSGDYAGGPGDEGRMLSVISVRAL
jgi:phosphatidylglycerol:prolipoprotein diacylglycerol transferase